jgi:hypothetical protein
LNFRRIAEQADKVTKTALLTPEQMSERAKAAADSVDEIRKTRLGGDRNDRRSTSRQHDQEGHVGTRNEVTINAYGAADPHGTARALYDLADRHAPLMGRNSKTAMA